MKNILTFCALLLFGCASDGAYQYAEPLFPETDSLTMSNQKKIVLSDSLMLLFPTSMLCTDDCIVLLDPSSSLGYLQIYEKESGRHIKTIIKKGRGPGEATQVGVMVSQNQDYIAVFAAAEDKFILYPKKHLKDTSQVHHEIEFVLSESSSSLCGVLIGDKMLLRSTNPQNRFSLINQTNQQNDRQPGFPNLIEHSTDNANVLSYANQISVSPDESKIVETAFIGGIMEIFSVEQMQLKQSALLTLSEPIYETTNNGSWVTWVDDTNCGFRGVSSCDKFIIAHYSGLKCSDESNISKMQLYNWSGVAVKQFITTDNILTFTYDCRNDLIFAVTSTNGVFALCQYPLSSY